MPAVLLLLAAGLNFVPGALDWASRAAGLLADHRAYAAWVLHGKTVPLPVEPHDHASLTEILASSGGALLAVGLAALGLFGRPLREALPRRVRETGRATVKAVRGAHSGHIGDYIAWWTAGAASLGAVCLLALR